jgi:hypothetical protein
MRGSVNLLVRNPCENAACDCLAVAEGLCECTQGQARKHGENANLVRLRARWCATSPPFFVRIAGRLGDLRECGEGLVPGLVGP